MSSWRLKGALYSLGSILTAIFCWPFIALIKEGWGATLSDVQWQDPLINTLLLMIAVIPVAILLGGGMAILMSTTTGRYHRLIHILMLCPIAIPTYIYGMITLGVWGVTGSIQKYLVEWGVLADFIAIPRFPVLVGVMGICYAPYVYVMCRAGMARVGGTLVQVAATLGVSPKQAVRRLLVPYLWPWILGSAVLVGMEVVADFGTVSVFNYATLSVEIYRMWFNEYNSGAAAVLGGLLIGSVWLLLGIGALWKIRAKAYDCLRVENRLTTKKMPNKISMILVGIGMIVVGGPIVGLVMEATIGEGFRLMADMVWPTARSLVLAIGVAAAVGITALLLHGVYRMAFKHNQCRFQWLNLGYALPGSLVGLMMIWIKADMQHMMSHWGLIGAGILSSTAIITIWGLWFRFFSLGNTMVVTQYQKISPELDRSAELLTPSKVRLLRHIHLPYIKTASISMMILVAIEVMKELPIVLITRPIGWDPLSTKIYYYMMEGLWAEAALPSLCLIGVGMVGVVAFQHKENVK